MYMTRQILSDLLQNFIREISRDCFAVQYIVSWTLVLRYHGTRDLVTPLLSRDMISVAAAIVVVVVVAAAVVAAVVVVTAVPYPEIAFNNRY